MNRRSFLKSTSFFGLPLMLNGMGLSAKPGSALFPTLNNNHDRILVIVKLSGGNDGLSMMVPIDQYDNLAKVRSNILVPQNKLLPLTDTLSLHPALPELRALYENRQLGIVQNVGYPNQNRSHFRSMDIWTTGSPSDEVWQTGWLGRYYNNRFGDFPKGYPNKQMPDPMAITMGNVVSPTCQGAASNFSVTIDDPFAIASVEEGIGRKKMADSRHRKELAFIKERISLTSLYSKTILAAAEKGKNKVEYPKQSLLAKQLKNVAMLIDGGLKTKIYIVSQGGYDTHGNQVLDGDPTKGKHAELLRELSQSIYAFQQDLKAMSLEDRVLGMTFSEFGRRIHSNHSLGTDHGTAAPLMLFGSYICAHILGDNPVINPKVHKMAGVEMQYDFRDVYGSVLKSLFKVEDAEIRQILYKDFSNIQLL